MALGLGAVFAFVLKPRATRLGYAVLGAGIGWTVLLLGTFYYIIANDTGPTWRDFLVDLLHAPLFIPGLRMQGTVVRELATGDVIRAVYTGLIIAGVVGAALWLGCRAGTTPSPPGPRKPGLIWRAVHATPALP